VQVGENRCVVELAGDDADVAELLDQLVGQGVRVQSFAQQEPTLEDVFMMVTKGLVT
jgi:ABC-2 type transport system ATP-binding protein